MTERPLQGLTETVVKLRRKIQQICDRKESIGEQNTKAVLIDPLLIALGWDIQDLDEVSREYRRKPKDNPVDYALFIRRSPRLFVEAKALEKDLSDRKWISQTLSYATVAGVEWCVLTNGDEYRLYNSHAAVDVDEKLFRALRISDPNQDEFICDTLDLLSKDKMGKNLLNVLWEAHYIDRRIKAALDDLFENKDPALTRLIRKKTPGLTPSEIRESLKRADIRIDFPMATVPVQPSTTPKVKRPHPAEPSVRKPKKHRTPKMLGVEVTDLIQAGLISPPLELETRYKGFVLKATIQEDGSVIFDGNPYDSLSTAAGMARRSIIGVPLGRRYPQTNGWTFWRYRDTSTGKLEDIDVLRQRYLQRKH